MFDEVAEEFELEAEGRWGVVSFDFGAAEVDLDGAEE